MGYRIDTAVRHVGEGIVDRQSGLSVRLKLTLSYAGFLMLTGFLMLVAPGSQAGQDDRSICCDTCRTM